MDRPLRDQIRYLELRMAECQARPALHSEQIRAYQAQLALARQSDTGIDYLERWVRSGTVMDVARAEWIDRHRNLACVHRALGNEQRVRAAGICLDAARAASPDGDFMARVMAAQVRAAALEHAAENSERALASLTLALLEWQVAAPGAKQDACAADVATIWAGMRAHDPACTWHRIREYPPYRLRLPFDDASLACLGDVLRQVLGAGAMDVPAGGPVWDAEPAEPPAPAVSEDRTAAAAITVAVPTAEQAAAGYRATWQALGQTLDSTAPHARELAALYERVAELERTAEDGPAFLRAMAEGGLYARLAKAQQLVMAREGLARVEGRGQPHAVHHFRALEQALAGCQSPTEVEYEVERGQAMYAVESAWCRVLLAHATRVVTAVAKYLAEPDARAGYEVAASHRVLGACLGLDWHGLFAVPWIDELLRTVWFPRARLVAADPAGSLGTRAGEVGTALIGALREAALARIIERSAAVAAGDPEHAEQRMRDVRAQPAFSDMAEMRAYLDRGFSAALGERAPGPIPAADQARLALWGRDVALHTLYEQLGRPARPMVTLTDDDRTPDVQGSS